MFDPWSNICITANAETVVQLKSDPNTGTGKGPERVSVYNWTVWLLSHMTVMKEGLGNAIPGFIVSIFLLLFFFRINFFRQQSFLFPSFLHTWTCFILSFSVLRCFQMLSFFISPPLKNCIYQKYALNLHWSRLKLIYAKALNCQVSCRRQPHQCKIRDF